MNRKPLFVITVVFFLLVLFFAWDPYSPSVSFENEYAEADVPLRVSVSGYPSGTSFSYEWTVGDHILSNHSDFYIPSESDLENFITVTVTPSGSFAPVTLTTYFSRLPVFYLTAEDEILREVYTAGTLIIQGNAIYPDSQQLYSGDIQIRGRGNSTWTSYPKKPYKIKLDTSADLFGMGDSKHWVLLANYADESLMRDKVAYDLSGQFGMPYMESTWVDVVFNGEYIGNYLLCEQIRIDENRVDITDLTSYVENVAKSMVKAQIFPENKQKRLEESLTQDLTWLSTGIFVFEDRTYDLTPYILLPDLTGGFLIEIDGYYDEISKFLSYDHPIMFKNPEYAYTNSELMDYTESYFNAFFHALFDSDDFYSTFQENNVSYTELFDIRSLAQYVLIQEIFFNYDAGLKSNFLYKDISSIAYMGPIWDMDWSSGNYGKGNSLISYEQWWSVYYTKHIAEKLWYSGVIRDPYFLSIMKEIWDSSHEEILSLVQDDGVLEQNYSYLYESGMANTEIWFHGLGFSSAYHEFKTWLTARIQWMDKQFTSLDNLIKSINIYQPDTFVQLTLEDNQVRVHVPYGDTAVFYLNSIRYDSIPLEDNSACWCLPNQSLESSSDVIMVRVYDENGNLIGSNYLDNRD